MQALNALNINMIRLIRREVETAAKDPSVAGESRPAAEPGPVGAPSDRQQNLVPPHIRTV